MDQAFRAARKAEPSGKVKLFYNECKQSNAPAVALALALPGRLGSGAGLRECFSPF